MLRRCVFSCVSTDGFILREQQEKQEFYLKKVVQVKNDKAQNERLDVFVSSDIWIERETSVV